MFLDRDGVLIRDIDLLTRPEQIEILSGVPRALLQLKRAGFLLVVVSNQAVVARGLASEKDVREVNSHLHQLLLQARAPEIDGWYFCPHHPNATLVEYRVDCDCRKPRAGLLFRAAGELGIGLTSSFIVGDRISDVIAGRKAGCKTVMVETGQQLAAPIETGERIDTSIKADYICSDLITAVPWILSKR